MRMIVHGVADDVGDLLGASVIYLIQRPEDPPLNRLEAVVDIGDGAGTDDVTCVIEEVAVDHFAEIIVGALLLSG